MIIVRPLPEAPGDYVVVRGGDVYRSTRTGYFPDTVKAGDIATSAEICDWEKYSIKVKTLGIF